MRNVEAAVIGSGPGGAMTATLLAEAGREVVLLERGKNLRLSSCPPYSLQEMQQKYHCRGMTAAFGKPRVAYVEGCCVGGGSEINAGLYHRLPEEILEGWRRDFNVQDIDASRLERIYALNERDIQVNFMPAQMLPLASLKLHEGAKSLAWKSVEVPRGFVYGEDGRQFKQSMTETFIPRALNAGTVLKAEVRVDTLRRAGDEWIVLGRYMGGPGERYEAGDLELRAKHVFLCGGAIATPHLLQKSGLSTLAGRGLCMHPTVKMVARFPDQINAIDMGIPVHQVKEFAPRLSLGCSISTPPYLQLSMIDVPGGSKIVRSHWQHMAIYYAMSRSGHGRVDRVPGCNDPLVRFDLGQDGIRDCLDGLFLLGQCLFEAGAVEVFPAVQGAVPIRSMRDLRLFLGGLRGSHLNLMTIHLFSSCPMGEMPSRCVADSHGLVHGQKNLYINDASLLCSSLGVNPQGALMMVARRNCEHFLASQ